MTVEELMEELKKFPKDTPVHIGWHELTNGLWLVKAVFFPRIFE